MYLTHLKLNSEYFYMHHSKLLPQTFSDYFLKHNQVHNYPARNSQGYRIYKSKKIVSNRAIRMVGPGIWNSLVKNISKKKKK